MAAALNSTVDDYHAYFRMLLRGGAMTRKIFEALDVTRA